MSVPSGFAEWCDFLGHSLVPATWPAQAHADYRAWRLERFRAHVRHYRDIGQWEIMRKQSGNRAVIDQVRRELAEALAPAPPQVYGRSSHTLPLRRDVGARFPSLGPVTLGWYARMGV